MKATHPQLPGVIWTSAYLALRDHQQYAVPPRGWIRAIRDALGMTAADLGRRMGVSQAAVAQFEKAEKDGSITLKSLRSAAEALDCTLVYALVPRLPLEDLIRDRASVLADQQLARTHHTMSLENQALLPDDLKAERARLIETSLRTTPAAYGDNERAYRHETCARTHHDHHQLLTWSSAGGGDDGHHPQWPPTDYRGRRRRNGARVA